jgi:hypothetical protein
MKRVIILLIVSAAVTSFGQFSSGTDYSIKKTAEKDEMSASFDFTKNDTEWKVGYDNSSSFTARSKIFGFGYELGGKNRYGEISVHYDLSHMIYELTSSVTVDSSSSGQSTNISLPDLSMQDVGAEAGIFYKDAYGIFGTMRYVSSKEADGSSFSGGVRLEYKYAFRSGTGITGSCGLSSEGDEDNSRYAVFITSPEPSAYFGAGLNYPSGSSEFSGKFKYLSLYKSAAGDKDKDYINAELGYKISIARAKSVISAMAGSYLTADMEAPEIHLPFFYNGLELKNSLIADRLNLSVGWKYEMYKSLLSDKIGSGFIPDEISSPEKLDETSGYNRIEIKVTYLY